MRKMISLRNIIFLSIVTTIIVTSLTLSKYKSTIATSDNTRVATPIITLDTENPQKIILTAKNPVENEQICYFTVKNSDEDKVSTEVKMRYTIQILSASNLPLDFELYTYEEETAGTTNLLEGNGNITDYIAIGFDTEQEHIYQLKIKWRENETSYKYSEVADYVQILLAGEQID